jgi:hypothetical protein
LKICSPVSVISSYNHCLKTVNPRKVLWNGKEYLITQTGLHHTYREGRTLFHVFSVTANNIFFRLILNTDNLFWQLDEIDENLAT